MKMNVDMPCSFKCVSDFYAEIRHFVVKFVKQSEYDTLENISQQNDQKYFYVKNIEDVTLSKLNSNEMV